MFFKNKELNKRAILQMIGLIFGILALIGSCVFYFLRNNRIAYENNRKMNMEELISLNGSVSSKSGRKVSLDIVEAPYLFALNEDETQGYYFVYSNDYFYVIKMSVKKYDDFENIEVDENKQYVKKIHIEGVSAEIPVDVKKLGADYMNDAFERNDITSSNFTSYFGDVAMDLTVTDGALAIEYNAFMIACFVVGLAFSFTYLKAYLSYVRINGMSKEKLENLLTEKDITAYPKLKLFITSEYIISYGKKLDIIPIKDIIVMYQHNMRYYFQKVSQDIIIFTKTRKLPYSIANTNMNKKKLIMFDEVFETIIESNSNIKVGATPENTELVKQNALKLKNNAKK